MNLVIFPGGGSPDNEKYKKVYDLLKESALNYGYKKVDILKWPGHANKKGSSSGEITLDGSVKVATVKIMKYEKDGIEYDILGRSYGTVVAVNLASEKAALRGLKKIILWGTPPYWVFWEMLKRDLAIVAAAAKSKGCYMDEKLFTSIIPVESMLPTLRYPIRIATGTEDPYSPVNYIDYLQSLVPREKANQFTFRKVNGAPHEVTHENVPPKVIKAYIKALFK